MNPLLPAFCLLLGGLLGAGMVWLGVRRGRRDWERQRLGADTVHQVQLSQSGMQAKLEEALRQLAAYQARINDFEKERAGSQAKLEEQLRQVVGAGAAMAQEARTLRTALATSSGVRGAWGEAVLKNILDTSGLNQQIDYDLQVVLPDDRRPDAVIYLPGGGKLAIDAKASLSDFLQGLEATEDAPRLAAFKQFAKVLHKRAEDLAKRDYCRSLPGSLPFVVMFVPSEAAFRAACDADRDLFLDCQKLRPPVMLASPSTLFPLMAVIHQSWQQHKASAQVQEMVAGVAELGKRLQNFLGHLQKVGEAIDDAGKAYNAAGASFRSRLSPQLRRLEDMNTGWQATEELKTVEHRPALAEAATEE